MNLTRGKHLYAPLIPLLATLGCGLIVSKYNENSKVIKDKTEIKKNSE